MKNIKKQKVRMATKQERAYWVSADCDNGTAILYVIERKVKNECSEKTNVKIWGGSIEDFYTKYNVMKTEEYKLNREKTYKQNFR